MQEEKKHDETSMRPASSTAYGWDALMKAKLVSAASDYVFVLVTWGAPFWLLLDNPWWPLAALVVFTVVLREGFHLNGAQIWVAFFLVSMVLAVLEVLFDIIPAQGI